MSYLIITLEQLVFFAAAAQYLPSTVLALFYREQYGSRHMKSSLLDLTCHVLKLGNTILQDLRIITNLTVFCFKGNVLFLDLAFAIKNT